MKAKRALAIITTVCMLWTTAVQAAEGIRADVLSGVPKKAIGALPNGYHFTEVFDKKGLYYSYYENEIGQRHLISSEDTKHWKIVETPGGTAYVNEKGHYMALGEEADELAVYVSTNQGVVWNKIALTPIGELDSPPRLTGVVGDNFILETGTERFASTNGSSWSKLEDAPPGTGIYYGGGYYFVKKDTGWMKSRRLVGTQGDWSEAFSGIDQEAVLEMGYDASSAEFVAKTAEVSYRSNDLKTWKTVSSTIDFVEGRPVRHYGLSDIDITALMEERYPHFSSYTLRLGEKALLAENKVVVGVQSIYYYEGHAEDVWASEMLQFAQASNARIDNIIYVSNDYGFSWTYHLAEVDVETIYGRQYHPAEKIQVHVEGERVLLSTGAIYHNQTIMLPLKELSRKLGATVIQTEDVIVITYGDSTATFTVGKKTAIVDRKERTFTENMIERNGDYLVQGDILMQLFGYSMGYSNTNRVLNLVK